MARIESWFEQDLKKPVPVRKLEGVFNEDSQANVIGVQLYDDGVALTSISGSVTGYFLLADGTTTSISGSKSGGKASVVIPPAAYKVTGPITITVRITDGSNITTVCACVGLVMLTKTPVETPAGSTVADWSAQISAQLAACQAAADAVGATVAVPFNEAVANDAGTYVTSSGHMYYLPNGHTANVSLANTTKVETNCGNELASLKSAFDYFGYNEKTIQIAAGATHSSRNDKMTFEVEADEVFHVSLVNNYITPVGYQIYAYYSDGTNGVLYTSTDDTKSGIRNKTITPTKKIISLGVYCNNSGSQNATEILLRAQKGISASNQMESFPFGYIGNNKRIIRTAGSNGGSILTFSDTINIVIGYIIVSKNKSTILTELGSSASDPGGNNYTITLTSDQALVYDQIENKLAIQARTDIKPDCYPLLIANYGGICGGFLLPFMTRTELLYTESDEECYAYLVASKYPTFTKGSSNAISIAAITTGLRIYSRTELLYYFETVDAFTIESFRKLVIDRADGTIKKVQFDSYGDYINLFTNAAGAVGGLLAPYYYRNESILLSNDIKDAKKDEECTIYFVGYAYPVITITELYDVIINEVTTGVRIYNKDGLLKYFATFGPYTVGKFEKIVYDRQEETIKKVSFSDNGDYINLLTNAVGAIGGLLEPYVQRVTNVSGNKVLGDTQKTEEFSALYNGVSVADTFIFFSDPHTMGKGDTFTHKIKIQLMDYMSIIKKYADEINPNTIICGGDWLNDSDTKDQACYKLRLLTGICKEYLGGHDFHNVLGNHDTNYQGIEQEGSAANTGTLSQDNLNTIMFANENTKESYFSFKTAYTSYYCLDTGTDWATAMDSYRWEQMQWLANSLKNDNPENAIVVMHIFSNVYNNPDDFGTDNRPMTEETVDIITAYNNQNTITVNGETFDFSNNTGTVRCILTGHTHYDKVYIADDNLPVICITDATDKNASPIKFDMGFLDYTNEQIVLVRVNDSTATRTVLMR